MSFLKAALDLATRKGFSVFPVQPNGKLPAVEDFARTSTTDPNKIRRWWVDPVLGLEQPYNIGISTSQNLLVVDVDVKKDGHASLLKLELEGKELPKTYTQTTPTGGLHLVYSTPFPVKQGVSVLGPGLDIRSRGGYIVGSGSEIDGKKYTDNGLSITPAPDWLIEACGVDKPKEKTSTPKTPVDVPQDGATARGVEYLTKSAPIAIEGAGGDHTTFVVAAQLKDFGLTEENALGLMAELWNPRCEPPWDISQLKTKVHNAYTYSKDPIGVSSPQMDFGEPDDESPEEDISYLNKMNKEYALIYMEGSHFILHETVDEKGRPKRVFLTETTFKRRFSPYTLQKGKGRAYTFAEMWLDWKGRREYRGVCFSPEKEPQNNYYNLWTGFAVQPQEYKASTKQAQTGFDMFMEHALENVCGGDKDLFNWLIGYFAHMIQKPYERPLTTLVFRGRKGVGKNALIDRVGKLLGSGHYLVAHDGRYLTSNFNGHLDACLCLVLDEAFWSGDKSAEGKLKGLTTAPEILIERKGKEPYMVDNFVRLVVIGNESWLVPASNDERRYAVFDVGIGRQQDNSFFEKMRIFMDEKGGAQILLHHLKTFDLKSVDVNRAPITEALMDQKLSSLDPVWAWWHTSISDGQIRCADFGTEWPETVDKERLRAAYRRYHKERNISSRIVDDRTFSKQLLACCPSLEATRARGGEGERLYLYKVPPLDQAREEWAQFVGHPVKWDPV